MENKDSASVSLNISLNALLHGIVFIFTFSEVLLSSRFVFISGFIFKIVGLAVNFCRVFLIFIFVLHKFKYNLKTFFKLLLMFVLIVVSYRITTIWALFDLLFVPVFLNELCSNKIYKWYAYAIITGCTVVVIAHFLGIMPELTFYRNNSSIRYAFGFSHPNTLSRYVMLLDILMVIRLKDKIKLRHIAMIAISAVFVYLFPNTNSVTAVLLMLTFGVFIYQYFKKNMLDTKIGRLIMIMIVPCFILLFLGMTIYYYGHIGKLNNPDNTLQSRFIMGFRGINRYGIHIFGNDVKFVSTSSTNSLASGEYFVIDSLFFYLPIRMGIVATVIFVFMYMKLILNAVKEYRFYDTMIIILIGFYSFFENSILSSYAFIFSFIMIEQRFNWFEGLKYRLKAIINKSMCYGRVEF